MLKLVNVSDNSIIFSFVKNQIKRNDIQNIDDQISGINGPQNANFNNDDEFRDLSMFNTGRGIHDWPINHKDSTIVTCSSSGQYCAISRNCFPNLSLWYVSLRAKKNEE